MELLRAKSDDKKMIFRKLFHTELYAKIVEELGKRRKGKQQEMAQIRTVCQTEVSHVDVPEDYEQAEELKELRKRIVSSDRLSVVDMERLLEDLERLCGILKDRCWPGQKEYDAADRKHLEKRDAYTAGVQLLKRFDELEQAEQELAACASKEDEVRETEEKVQRISGAYEIQAVFQRYMDAVRTAENTRKNLSEQEAAIPVLTERAKRRSGRQRQRRKGWPGDPKIYASIREGAEVHGDLQQDPAGERRDGLRAGRMPSYRAGSGKGAEKSTVLGGERAPVAQPGRRSQ